MKEKVERISIRLYPVLSQGHAIIRIYNAVEPLSLACFGTSFTPKSGQLRPCKVSVM